MPAPADFERIYDEHAQALFHFLLNFTRNEADTRDILQEIFVKLAGNPGWFEGARDERSFLIRLARNQAVDFIRRRGTREKNYEQLAKQSVALFAPAADPDQQAFHEAVSAALGELPADQRAVVHLKLWEKATFEQIADILDIPQNTAASRYRYGLDKIRDRLRPLYDEIK